MLNEIIIITLFVTLFEIINGILILIPFQGQYTTIEHEEFGYPRPILTITSPFNVSLDYFCFYLPQPSELPFTGQRYERTHDIDKKRWVKDSLRGQSEDLCEIYNATSISMPIPYEFDTDDYLAIIWTYNTPVPQNEIDILSINLSPNNIKYINMYTVSVMSYSVEYELNGHNSKFKYPSEISLIAWYHKPMNYTYGGIIIQLKTVEVEKITTSGFLIWIPILVLTVTNIIVSIILILSLICFSKMDKQIKPKPKPNPVDFEMDN